MAFIVKNTTFCSITDLVAPHSCRGCRGTGEVLCRCCKNDIILQHVNYCPNCRREIYGDKCPECKLPPTFMVGFRDAAIGELIHDFKYNATRAAGKVLAELMAESLPEIGGKVALVPLPTIRRHIRERGFDHTKVLAKKIARIKSWEVKVPLKRSQDTVQVGSDEEKRVRQAWSAYEVTEKLDSAITYVLFDDVWTTGASMKAALKKMQKAGAKKLIIAVLAVSRTGN